MIYDETHQMFLVHRRQQRWFLVWNEKLSKRDDKKGILSREPVF